MSTDSNQATDKAFTGRETAKRIRETRKQVAAAGSFVVFVFFVNMLLLGVFIVGPDFTTRTVVFNTYCVFTILGVYMAYLFVNARLDYNKLLSDATQESER